MLAMEAIAMRRRPLTALAAAAGLVIASAPLLAHHSNAAFDASKRLTITGAVTRKDAGEIEIGLKGSNRLGDHVVGTVVLALPDAPVGKAATKRAKKSKKKDKKKGKK